MMKYVACTDSRQVGYFLRTAMRKQVRLTVRGVLVYVSAAYAAVTRITVLVVHWCCSLSPSSHDLFLQEKLGGLDGEIKARCGTSFASSQSRQRAIQGSDSRTEDPSEYFSWGGPEPPVRSGSFIFSKQFTKVETAQYAIVNDRDDLKYDDPEACGRETLGLRWEEVSQEEIKSCTEIKNDQLANSLEKKLKEEKLVFTKEEWGKFEAVHLSDMSYIKLGEQYFKPFSNLRLYNVHLLRHLVDVKWNIKRPDVIFSITGGAMAFDLNSKNKDLIMKVLTTADSTHSKTKNFPIFVA